MRKNERAGSAVTSPSRRLLPALRLAAIVLGVGLVLSATHARAADGEDDDTFEEKIIKNIMTGLGGTNMENSGINYRERSPLVVPPRIDLPPPATDAEVTAPNWPKDPDIQRRKAAAAARKNERKLTPTEGGRSLLPSELAQRAAPSAASATDSAQPGNSSTNPMLSPSQLGFNGSLLGMFKGNNSESAPFTGEPTRDSLTQPPTGYQTPSPNYAYGEQKKGWLDGTANPDRNPLSQRSSESSVVH